MSVTIPLRAERDTGLKASAWRCLALLCRLANGEGLVERMEMSALGAHLGMNPDNARKRGLYPLRERGYVTETESEHWRVILDTRFRGAGSQDVRTGSPNVRYNVRTGSQRGAKPPCVQAFGTRRPGVVDSLGVGYPISFEGTSYSFDSPLEKSVCSRLVGVDELRAWGIGGQYALMARPEPPSSKTGHPLGPWPVFGRAALRLSMENWARVQEILDSGMSPTQFHETIHELGDLYNSGYKLRGVEGSWWSAQVLFKRNGGYFDRLVAVLDSREQRRRQQRARPQLVVVEGEAEAEAAEVKPMLGLEGLDAVLKRGRGGER